MSIERPTRLEYLSLLEETIRLYAVLDPAVRVAIAGLEQKPATAHEQRRFWLRLNELGEKVWPDRIGECESGILPFDDRRAELFERLTQGISRQTK